MIKKILCSSLMLLAISSVAFAESKLVTLDFDYDINPDSFRVYERILDGKELMTEGDGSLRMLSFTKDIATDNCHTFFIAAVTSDIESYSSNGITWCPEITMPPYIQRPLVISGQSITITVE